MWGDSPKENSLWVEKYRPKNLDSYVGNENLKKKVSRYIKEGDVPHLLLFGNAGTGKTTLAKLIVKNIECDHMYINASDENSVDVMRNKIKDFASSVGFKPLKVIILDECDFLTPNAQAALRNLMETFSRHCRFILTCNYVEKVIDPIQSRCQVFGVTPPSKADVARQVSSILTMENIKYNVDKIKILIDSGYPDIRRVINSAQRQVIDGSLDIDEKSIIENDYKLKLLEYLQKNDMKTAFNSIRKLLADAKVRDYTDLYKLLYDELDSYADGHKAGVILIIAEHQYMDTSVVEKEINVMSMIVKILGEIK
jgi:replication factor C small subunit